LNVKKCGKWVTGLAMERIGTITRTLLDLVGKMYSKIHSS